MEWSRNGPCVIKSYNSISTSLYILQEKEKRIQRIREVEREQRWQLRFGIGGGKDEKPEGHQMYMALAVMFHPTCSN